MPSTTRELRAFVASPSDCIEERRSVRTVADQVTQSLGTELGWRIQVTGWEQVPPDFGRPQGQINPLVDECDLFIGILGHRWGSPTGTHPSGFLEEFERAVARRNQGAVPQIALYFRTVPEESAADPGRQLQEVLAFRQRLQDEGLNLYRTFDGIKDLENQLWQLLTNALGRIGAQNDKAPEGTGSSPSPIVDTGVGELDDAQRQIAATVDAVARRARGDTNPEVDTDRFLLIALGLNRNAGSLPTHVVNRLYLRAPELVLAVVEARTWLRTILADLGTSPTPAGRVVPGWTLVRPSDDEMAELLSGDDDEVAIGIFRFWLRVRRRPEALWPEQPTELSLTRWRELLGRSRVTDAAVEYLAGLARTSDMPLLDALAEDPGLPAIREQRDFLAGDPNSLAIGVAESYSPAPWKVDALRDSVGMLNDQAARALATSRTSVPLDLRLKAYDLLEARGRLDEATLQILVTRDDMFDALFASATNSASSLTPEAIASAVAGVPNPKLLISDLPARVTAATKSVDELLGSLDPARYSLDAWDALGWSNDPRLISRARAIFDSDAAELVAPLAELPRWGDSPNLLPFVRASARVSALRILASQVPVADEDRARVRVEVVRDDVYSREDVLTILARIATPDDVPDLLARYPKAFSPRRDVLVRTILELGGSVAARAMIESGEGAELTAAVTQLGSDPSVADAELFQLLYSAKDHVRVAALEALTRRGPTGLDELLRRYTAPGHYFYNVVAELDWLMYLQAAGQGFDAAATADQRVEAGG